MRSNHELSALINLIDDPDEIIFGQIRDELVSFGNDIIPTLENAWETRSFGALYQNRIENIIHTIQFNDIKNGLNKWKEADCKNLLDGALLVSKYQYPDLDERKIRLQFNQLIQDVWIEFNDNLTSFEKIRVINHILFEVHGFSGNKKNYHAPHNSYINQVLETKRGNPLSLSIIYIIIAQSLGLPIYGVNLPSHFIAVYKDSVEIFDAAKKKNASEDILFYINTFSRGVIFDKNDIDRFLKQLKLEKKKTYYEPCNNKDIVLRLFNNLINSYEKLGNSDKVLELTELKKTLD